MGRLLSSREHRNFARPDRQSERDQVSTTKIMKRLHPFKSFSVPQRKKHRSDSGSLQRWSGKVQIDTITVLLKTQGAGILHLLKRRMGFCTVTTLFNGIFQDWYLHSYPAIDGYNRTASDIWVIFFMFLVFHMEGVYSVCEK